VVKTIRIKMVRNFAPTIKRIAYEACGRELFDWVELQTNEDPSDPFRRRPYSDGHGPRHAHQGITVRRAMSGLPCSWTVAP